jgi:protein-L-isoaspartate(D-aspartate) O-methyltransferase
LALEARVRLDRLDYGNINTRVDDGYYGSPEDAPFDKIIVTAAPELIPPPLIRQLKCGGKLVLPAGLPESQKLILAKKDRAGRLSTQEILDVRFSPLEGGEEHPFTPSFFS